MGSLMADGNKCIVVFLSAKLGIKTNMVESLLSASPEEKEFHQVAELHLQSIFPVLEQMYLIVDRPSSNV